MDFLITKLGNFKIGTRLLIGFSIVLLFTFIVGFLAIGKLQVLAGLTDKLYRHPYTVSTATRDIKANLASIQSRMKDIHLAQSADQIDEAVTAINMLETDTFDQFGILKERFLGDQAIIDRGSKLFREWRPLRDDLIALSRAGEINVSETNAGLKETDHLKEIEAAITAVVDFAANMGISFHQNAADTGRQAIIFMLFLLGATTIAGALISIIITISLTRPLGVAIGVLQAIEEGDGDLTQRLNITSNDEIGRMGQLLDSFMALLHDMLKGVVQSTQRVYSAAEEITSASEVFAQGAGDQQDQLAEVATTFEEMTALITEATQNAVRTRENTDQTAGMTTSGREAVARTVEGFGSVAEKVQEAVERLLHLDGSSKQIGGVVQTIVDIADQTNLLALNANIEAARAGDAGRGFAVVAEEVRKLADRTVQATGEIGQLINNIQTEIQETVEFMNTVQGLSQEGMRLISKSDDALEQISSAISDAALAVDQIASSANEQSAGVEQISKNIQQVTRVANDTARSAQELTGSAQGLKSEVDSLTNLTNRFKL